MNLQRGGFLKPALRDRFCSLGVSVRTEMPDFAATLDLIRVMPA
jgi:hypothetical protein